MAWHSFKKSHLVAAAAIVIVVSVCYHHTVNYPFVNWDDYTLIRDNPYNKSLDWQNLKQLLNPFVTGSVKVARDFSHAIDFRLWGDNTLGFHLGNLFFYALASLLVFSLLRQIIRHDLAALFGVLLFVAHPLHVESVTWLSARKEALGATFFLLAFLVYIRKARPGYTKRPWYWLLALFLYILAMFSKETTVVLPAMIVLYEAAFGDRTSKNMGTVRRCFPTIPFFVIGIAFTILVIHISAGINVLKPFHRGSVYSQVLSALVGPFTGIRLLFAPVNLSARYVDVYAHNFFNFPVITAILCLAGMLYVAWDNWKHSRVVSLCILWYFITLAPVSNLVPISTLVADRYLFLPSIGFCLLLGYALRRTLEWYQTTSRRKTYSRVVLALFPLIFLVFGYLTYKRNYIWKDNYSLWKSVVEQDPRNLLGHVAFANVAMERKDYELAEKEFKRALWLSPRIRDAYVGLGNLYLMQEDWDRAIFYYNYALSDTSQDPTLHIVMGEYFQEKGRQDKAMAHFAEALRIDSLNVSANVGMVDAYVRRGRINAALIGYDSLVARQLLPPRSRIQKNIGLAYYKKNEFEQAIGWFQKAIEVDSSDAELQLAIARAHDAMGDLDMAEKAYQKALEISPDYVEALVNIGALYQRQRDYPEAVAHYKRALEIAPENSNVLNNLAMVHHEQGDDREALSILAEIVGRDSTFIPARVNIAAILIEQEDMTAALEQLELAAAIDPDHPTVQFNSAYCFAKMGRIDEAFKAFVQALHHGFDDEAEVTELLGVAGVEKDHRFARAWEKRRSAR
ncbi:MAG: tetratricopeptide repeat protein [Candidatus Latescibacteria bacterium]|nr:tetratricopeptide repeat protein [Candidatus Latescibacterota bacterium]NIM21774.1 tetratricopeptide repeat protein [Candidatus Latescibacterota bacterium]NIM65912.1 tetratricopeptide repeat protein [Candidatus Latescibacterota bacterium]NIO02657.1 tetratricopeptide repeat protein [Candidatus Latescibacterota bacterium]NIO29638.1 tetratricopeptide repeat protein [Candidatus Latescibacterota bacterium]